MSLINCPDCGTEVSSLALACPKCARPISAPPTTVVSSPQKTQTIEATGKGWKAVQLGGFVVACLGLISCFGAFSSTISEAERTKFAQNGVNFFFAGGVAYLVGKIGGWWYHG